MHTKDYTIFTTMKVYAFATLTMPFTSCIKAWTIFINITVIDWYYLLNTL